MRRANGAQWGSHVTWPHGADPASIVRVTWTLGMLLSLASAVATFLLCCWIARVVTGPFAHMHWLLQDMHDAFAFTDPKVVVAFLVGLVCSATLLYRLGALQTQPALSKDEWRAFKLIERTRVSHSSSVYRFAIPHKFGLPIGQHVSVRAPLDGQHIVRSYTPISDHNATGYVDFLVKTYEAGNVSRVFDRLQIGESLEMRGPKGRFTYARNMAPQIGMLAGGTGITPCLQILRAALRDPKDRTQFSLLYANVSEDEILLRDELTSLQHTYPHRFSVHYFLNIPPPAGWTGGVGFITREAIAQHLPPASADCRILMCGPPPMMEAMKKHLSALQFPIAAGVYKHTDKVFVF